MLFLSTLLSLFCFKSIAKQINLPEPEFIGSIVYVENNAPIELEKLRVSNGLLNVMIIKKLN